MASRSQSALDSRAVHNPGPSWDFCPGLRLARSPLQGETIIALIAYLSVVNGSGESDFALTVITAVTLPPATKAGDFALAS